MSIIKEKIEEITGIVFIGNDDIGYVDRQDLYETLNMEGLELKDEDLVNAIQVYNQMCNGGHPEI